MNDAAREALLKAQAWLIAAAEADPRIHGVTLWDNSDIALHHTVAAARLHKPTAWGWSHKTANTLDAAIAVFDRAYEPPDGDIEIASWQQSTPSPHLIVDNRD